MNEVADRPKLDAIADRLFALGEPSLRDTSDPSRKAYRCTIWGSKDVIASRASATATRPLTAVVARRALEDYAESAPSDIATTHEISAAEWDAVVRAFQAKGFDKMEPAVGPGSYDGAWWVLEASQGGKDRFVLRMSPRAGDFRELCCQLFALASRDSSLPPVCP